MKQYYYLDSNNQQMGPIYPTQFITCGITGATKVWCAGMDSWVPAGDIPELAPYIIPSVSNNPLKNPNAATNSGTGFVPCPPSNLVWAILTTLLCCLPFGIVSIVYAAQVDSEWTKGNYENAYKKSRLARNWAIVAAITGVVSSIISLVCGFFGAILESMH